MTPALWSMRPPWRTDGWTASELIGVVVFNLGVKALFAAVFAGFLVMVMRGVMTSPNKRN